MSKRILITGGSGFIGSNLTKKLLTLGHEILCVDNFYTGTKENIKPFLDNSNYEFIRHDICFPLYVEVDEIYNLACPASPIHYRFDPVQTTKVSVLGVINVLGIAKRLKVPLLQASTSEIYGDPEVHPQEEGYNGNVNPIGPRSCYDEGKRCAETLIFDYRRQHGLNTKIVRIFNTFGPNMHINDGRVVSNFIVQALQDKEITIYGDGSQTRSFCFVDDLVEGLIMMMNTSSDISGPVNLGMPRETTIKELANIIIDMIDSRSRLKYLPLPQDDPIRRKPDISKAQKILKWTPSTKLEEGLKKTIEYFKDLLSQKIERVANMEKIK